MIKSDEGHINIEGRNIGLTVEWVVLYKAMIKHHPEIVAETCLAYRQELLDAYINPLEAAIVHSIVQTVKENSENE